MVETHAARLAELVKSGLERDPQEWPSFLDETCGSDADLRAEVESLLHFQQPARGFLQQPAMQAAAAILVPDRELGANETIGDYEILSLIGSGGMGDVYLAQDRKLRRNVALKIVRRGLDTHDLTRRFQREEQILAGLTHPNIARLYDGAVTAGGAPYFVMEYIDGSRLDHYCSENKLSVLDRLLLFRKVCGAVTYAHQRLVIHRDIKPSNIRVTAEGEPKLLDFGIAKLLHPATGPSGEETMTFSAAMTPEYASPEQLRGEAIATTSDVYSLGVVLYKLLTSQSPYRTKTTRPDELARAINEQNPERPSTAIRHLPFSSHYSRSLRGDLDNIVLMAMRKEPSRRYESAAQFSADIQRHLEGLPVVARKDTFTYRASKFIKRHRVGVAAAFLIVVSLVAGMATTAWQAQAARQEKAKAEEIKNFLERTLRYSNPHLAGKDIRETTVTEVLNEASRRLETEKFSDQPEIKAELEQVIYESYFGQGKYDLARKHLRKYVDLQSKLNREDDSKELGVSFAQAALLFEQGDMSESEKSFRQLLPMMRNEKQKGKIKADVLVNALSTFGYLRRTQGDSKEAESLFRETLALGSQIPKESLYLIGQIRSTLASTLADQGRFEEALQTAREAVAEHRQRGETDTPNFTFTLTVLGGLLTEKGDYTEADMNLREAEAIQRKILNPSHLWLGDNLRNQAISFYLQGRYPEALSKVTETLKIYRESWGTFYDHYPTALMIQGLILANTGQPKEGEKILREAVKIRTDLLPKGHYWIALARSALGECLTIEKRYNEAEPLLLESYESVKGSQGTSNPRTQLLLQRVITLYENWGRLDAAKVYRGNLSKN